MKPATSKQPRSTPNGRPAIWDLVLADIQGRDEFGAAKHGTRLQAGNGRESLVDAYQELLDLVVYVRQELAVREEIRGILQAALHSTKPWEEISSALALLGDPER